MKHLFSKEEINQIDQQALKEISENHLISEVGRELSKWFLKHISDQKKILILSGPGNNGKDGLALVEELRAKKYDVDSLTLPLEESIPFENYDVVVDAVFGISIDKDIDEDFERHITKLDSFEEIKKVSLDLPSGVDPDTGKVWGTAFKADHTLAIGGLKPGLFLAPALSYVGEIDLIEIPSLKKHYKDLSSKQKTPATLLNLKKKWLKTIKPKTSDHKYSRGKVVLVLDQRFPGACLLAALASEAAGAGYVHIYCDSKIIANIQPHYPQFVFTPFQQVSELKDLLENEKECGCFALGGGWASDYSPLYSFLQNTETSCVLDGGVLKKEILKFINHKEFFIMTPHTGELDRMVGQLDTSLPETKMEKTQMLAEEFSGVILAKGYDSIIYQQSRAYIINHQSSAFLAHAGMGDILTGLIASFIAQGLPSWEATQLGQCIQNTIAEKLNFDLTCQRFINEIPAAIKELYQK